MGNIMPWRVVKHFNYTFLRNAFRTVLLNQMETVIGKSFKKVKAFIYKNCPNGFYVYAKPKLTNTKEVAKYIGRYLGRPVIATSRMGVLKNTPSYDKISMGDGNENRTNRNGKHRNANAGKTRIPQAESAAEIPVDTACGKDAA